MRILLIHRYFWPDTSPYGILLRRIAEHFASEGHTVTVFTGKPTYSADAAAQGVASRDQLSDNLMVRRAWLFPQTRLRVVFRLLNDLLFCFRIVLHILWRRPQIVMCSTQPPVIGAAAASFAARLIGAPFIYHMQDIHPEVVCETGHVRNSVAMRFLKWLDCRTIRRAKKIIVLSDDMKDAIAERDRSAVDQVRMIPNYNLPRFDDLETPPAEMTKHDGCFRLMFAGVSLETY